MCFLQFYGNYSPNNKFDNFYTQDLINHFSTLNAKITEEGQFKIFCFAFFQQISKEFIDCNYAENQSLFDLYNPRIVNDMEMDIDSDLKTLEIGSENGRESDYKTKLMDIFKGYTKLISNKINNVKKQILTPLVSATERVVDMVLAVSYTNL